MLTNLSPTKRTRSCPTPPPIGGELDRAVRAVNATLGMTGKQPCNGPPLGSVR